MRPEDLTWPPGDVAVIARKLGASFTTLTAPVAAEIAAEQH